MNIDGSIPDDWKVILASDLCRLQRGFDITEATRVAGSVPVYSSSGISYFHARAAVQPPAVVTGRKGLLGRVFYVDEPFWPHDTTLWADDFNGNDPRFVAAVLAAFHLERLDAATSVPTLNRNNLTAYEVMVPLRRVEQAKIAAVILDADTLIEALEKLIAKKRDVKQGMVQELLTGRTRLPGYSAGWELSAFDEVMEVVNTRGSQVDANKYCEVGTFPVVDQGKEFIAGYVGSEHSPISPGADGVLVFGDHTTISKYVDFDFVVGADGTKVLRSRSSRNYLSRYICYCLELYPVESTGYNRHFGKLRERQFLLPRGEEQRAIAKILQDADAELAALEQRLESARAVKVGIMQELLTGRTRLPMTEEA